MTSAKGRRLAVTRVTGRDRESGRSWQNHALVHGHNTLVVASVRGKSGGREVGVAGMPTRGILEVKEVIF